MAILYHYCSAGTFHSIVDKRAIWLSSLSMSNDSMEGKLALRVLAQMAKDEGIEDRLMEDLSTALEMYEQFAEGLGICLSEDGDLLSQWRGYAGDATGFAIGFDSDYLRELVLHISEQKEHMLLVSQVIYDPAAQADRLKPLYAKFKKAMSDGAFESPTNWLAQYGTEASQNAYHEQKMKARSALAMSLSGILEPLFLLKTSAFREEREWRIVAIAATHTECLFRASGDKIVPYREYELATLSRDSIVQVMLGPKNPTPKKVVEAFLESKGFGNISVQQSKATYR